MKLNIEKLKSKLNNISNSVHCKSNSVHCKVDKFYKDIYGEYWNVIELNNLIRIYLEDNEDLKDSIDKLYCTSGFFRTEDFDKMRATLDFIQSNEDAIKTAMLESIE